MDDNQIQLISDGEGLAVIGSPDIVERFLTTEGLPSKDLGLQRATPTLGAAAGVAQAGAQIAANSGRWVKLTKESAHLAQKYGLMQHKATGLDMGVVHATGQAQGIKAILKFEPGSLGRFAANPAMLAGAAGIMAQIAMQQTMEQITDYLATIDRKVDDVLRAQKDAVLADMIGVDLVIEDALTSREHVGRVSEVTWSKVQATALTVARTQAYALRQLDALAEKVERSTQVGELAGIAKEAQTAVREWLAVLARCFQLQDGIAVLELDRVLDASPEELDQHRRGLQAARQNRRELIARSTVQVMARLQTAADTANAKVLLHPIASPSVVQSSNHVAVSVVEFQSRLGIAHDQQALEARQWRHAAVQARDDALKAGAEGVDAARRLGVETFDRATEAFRPVDLDGDGVPDKPRALSAAEDAGSAIQGAAAGMAGAVGSLFRRKREVPNTMAPVDPQPEEDGANPDATGS